MHESLGQVLGEGGSALAVVGVLLSGDRCAWEGRLLRNLPPELPPASPLGMHHPTPFTGPRRSAPHAGKAHVLLPSEARAQQGLPRWPMPRRRMQRAERGGLGLGLRLVPGAAAGGGGPKGFSAAPPRDSGTGSFSSTAAWHNGPRRAAGSVSVQQAACLIPLLSFPLIRVFPDCRVRCQACTWRPPCRGATDPLLG